MGERRVSVTLTDDQIGLLLDAIDAERTNRRRGDEPAGVVERRAMLIDLERVLIDAVASDEACKRAWRV